MPISVAEVRQAIQEADGAAIIKLCFVDSEDERLASLDVEFNAIYRDQEGRIVIQARATLEE